jgi:hypothetical protein
MDGILLIAISVAYLQKCYGKTGCLSSNGP